MSSISDPIGDFLTRLRNAQHGRRTSCRAPWSKIKQQLCDVLKREGWIESAEVVGDEPKLELEVTFIPGKKINLKRISKPGRRSYSGSRDLRPVLHGYGIAILTTSKGLLTDTEARKQKVGGEVLCTIF